MKRMKWTFNPMCFICNPLHGWLRFQLWTQCQSWLHTIGPRGKLLFGFRSRCKQLNCRENVANYRINFSLCHVLWNGRRPNSSCKFWCQTGRGIAVVWEGVGMWSQREKLLIRLLEWSPSRLIPISVLCYMVVELWSKCTATYHSQRFRAID